MELPFFAQLRNAQNVLIAGAGGGFDVYAGLPLLAWLQHQGKTVHLANLSFVDPSLYNAPSPISELVIVEPDSTCQTEYAPELVLAQWLKIQNRPLPVHAIARTGVRGVTRAYRWLHDELNFDTVILVDGGTDILMRGDEPGLGTPQEDIASLLAADALPQVEQKFVVCLGFGVDSYHGVSHASVLENIAAMVEDDGYLGAWSLTRGMEETKFYCDAVEYASAAIPHMPSIVNKSVTSSILGWFGDRHFTQRTHGSELFLSPLMGLYWAFRLDSIASRLMYREEILESESIFELSLAIERFRDGLPSLRTRQTIPH